MVLSELLENAKVLVVGAGTGAELIYLARMCPNWYFTVVGPDKEMLDACRKKCEENEILSRCSLHQGTVETLPGNKTGVRAEWHLLKR